jgi:hypothetical protein
MVLTLLISGCDSWREPVGPEETTPLLVDSPNFAHMGPVPVTICHRTGGARRYVEITVSDRALAAHLRHGDGLVGDSVPSQQGMVFDEHCVPVRTTILIDASHDGGVWWFPQAGPFNPAEPHQGKAFADYLRSLGQEVVELGRGVEITDELLRAHDKVVRAGAFNSYSASEIAAYENYMARSDVHLVLVTARIQSGLADAISESIGLPMEGAYTGVMTPVGNSSITEGVGPLNFGPGAAVGPSPTAAVTALGTLQDGRVVLGEVTSEEAHVLFLGDLLLLERVPQPLVSNLAAWLYH